MKITQAEIREACNILRKILPTDAEVQRFRELTDKFEQAKRHATKRALFTARYSAPYKIIP